MLQYFLSFVFSADFIIFHAFFGNISGNGLPLCEVFRESLLSKKNLAKRVMGDSRAKATIVSRHPRSGSPMGKIVLKGDFSHRSAASRQLRTS